MKKIEIKLTKKQKRFLLKAGSITAAAILVLLVQYIRISCQIEARYEEKIAALTAAHEEEIAQLTQEHNKQIEDILFQQEHGASEDILTEEARMISKVVYGMAGNHDKYSQKAVIWCILNRVDNTSFPSTVSEVCRQPKQWIEFNDKNPIVDEIYDAVMTELSIYHNGRRPVDDKYVFLSWSTKEIILRDEFIETAATRYWKFY